MVCYLCPGGMTRVRGKLEAELRPGALVISNTFAMPDWSPEHTITLDDLHRTPVYRYRVPESFGGRPP